jgi:hypothetical protein
MAAIGALEKLATELGKTKEEAIEAITAEHKTIQAMSWVLKTHHSTVLYWLRMYDYEKDPITGYWVKRGSKSGQPQNAA